MENSNPSTFEVALQAAKATAAGSLKAANIKRLIKLLGKRPSDIGLQQIAELVAGASDNEVLVYDLLCEIEMARKPDMPLALLRPALSEIAASWMGGLTPGGQTPEVLDWLRTEAVGIISSTPPDSRRFRGVLLWLLGQYRSPDFFLMCIVELSQNLRNSKRSPSAPLAIERTDSGFVMARIAKTLAALGRGKRPKLTKLPEMGVVIKSVLAYVAGKMREADAAISRLGDTVQSLEAEKALSQQQAATIQTLETRRISLENHVTELSGEVERLKTLHTQALDHATHQISEARRTMIANLKSKIQPRLTDAKLYVNRSSPAVDQVLRLLGEAEQVLNSQEANV